MMDAATTPCPGCGTASSEDYDGNGACWSCFTADGTEPARGPIVTRASNVRTRRVEYCWRGRWPIGYLTIQTGEEKIGKTAMFIKGAADLTNGQLDGKFYGQPTAVLIVAVEDALDDMWVPRLVAAGADLELVEFLNIPADGWNVRDGIPLIEQGLEETGAKLVFIDAVMEHLPDPRGGENANSTTFVRKCLRPLASMSERRRITSVISTHPPKRRAVSFADFYSASAAFTQVSRACLLFGWHPDDYELPEEQRRRVLLRARANVGRDPGALSFRIDAQWLKLDDGNEDEVPYATDVETCKVTVRDLLRADRPQAPDPEQREPGKQEQLEQTIAEYLADGGWHPSLSDELKQDGWKHSTIQAARSKVAKARKQPGTMDGPWQWRLLDGRSSQTSDSSTLPSASRARSVYVNPDSSTLRDQTPANKEEPKSQESATNNGRPHTEEPKSQESAQTSRASSGEDASDRYRPSERNEQSPDDDADDYDALHERLATKWGDA